MKFKNLLLPHPVLGQEDDINGICDVRNVEIKTDEKEYSILFEIDHDNGTIIDMVKFDKAIYCCEVKCSATYYRELFISKTTTFSFNISRGELKNRVEFEVFCATTAELKAYNNVASHPDYADFNFQLDKGDIIALFGEFNFNADIQYQKLKAASSFMQIIPNESNKEYTEYVLDDSKIQIKLPKAVYEKYKQDSIGKRKEFSEIIHASFVQNALIIALYNFEDQLARKVLWAESIRYRLLNEQDINNGSDIIDPVNIPTIVQKLLGNPNQRLVDRLEILTETFD